MSLDAIPGLNLGLAAPGESLEIAGHLLDGTVIEFVTVVPNLMATLCVKTVGYGDRRAQKDALDVWRLLEAYRLLFPPPSQWAQSGSAGDAAKILRREVRQAQGKGSAQHPAPGQTGLEFTPWGCPRWDPELRS